MLMESISNVNNPKNINSFNMENEAKGVRFFQHVLFISILSC